MLRRPGNGSVGADSASRASAARVLTPGIVSSSSTAARSSWRRSAISALTRAIASSR